VLDDDFLVGDDDAFHHQPQDPLLGLERWVGELCAEPRAERLHRPRQGRRPLRLGDLLGHHLLPLPYPLPRLAEALPTLLQLVQLHGPDLVGVDEALLLPREGGALLPEALQLPLGVGELRPVAGLLLAQVAHDEGGLAQQPGDVVPDDRLDVALAHAAQLAAALPQFRRAPSRAFVAPTRHTRVAAEPPPAVAAGEQAGEQVLAPRLAGRAFAVELQLARGQREDLRADERRPGDGDPLLGRAQAAARVLGRAPRAGAIAGGLGCVHASIIGVRARVEAAVEDLVDAGWGPGHLGVARRHAQGGQPAGEGVGGELLLDQPSEELPHDRRLRLVDDAPPVLAIAPGEIGVAVRAGTREEGPLPRRVELPPPAALLEGGALELGEEPMHLAHQPLLRAVVERPVDEDDRTPGALQLLDDDVLVGVVAGEPVGGEDEHAVQLAAPHGVAQALQPRPVEPRAAVTVVEVPVLRRDGEPVLGGVGGERRHLAGDRPLLLLLGRGNASIQCDVLHAAPSR